MKREVLTIVGALALALPAVGLQVTPAAAKIRCEGSYQVVDGNRISTPYCEDNYLAQVARQYGSKVTARQIRNSPSKKQEICQWIGHDTRVQDICAGWRDDDTGRGRY